MNKVRLTINIDYNTMSYYIRNHYINIKPRKVRTSLIIDLSIIK